MNYKKIKVDIGWTLFLDRDGVLNTLRHNDYVKTVEEFEWIGGVKPTMAFLSKIFGRIIVVTNQQGVGKGLMSAADLENIHCYMMQEISTMKGRIDRVYSATVLASADSAGMRKPGTMMPLQAKDDFPEIDFAKSMIIGDSESDMLMGRALGMWTILCNNTNEKISADYKIKTLSDVIALLEF